MNFNEEIEQELKPLGLGGRIFNIPEEDKATSEDYANFQKRMDEKSRENEIMLDKSLIYAKNSLPC